MKSILRYYLINFGALFIVSRLIPGLNYEGGLATLALGAVIFMAINIAVVPLLKVMFLPLNLLTLGIFAWVVNVLALYIFTLVDKQFKLTPFIFPGAHLSWVTIPFLHLNIMEVAVVSSFFIGLISHLLTWLVKD